MPGHKYNTIWNKGLALKPFHMPHYNNELECILLKFCVLALYKAVNNCEMEGKLDLAFNIFLNKNL